MLVEQFYLKILMLIGFFILAGLVDYLVKKNEANRWKEYLFILCFAGLISLVGLVYDQIIVTISPEYFAVAKALGYEDLRFLTAMMGLKAGFVAGCIMSGSFLMATKSKHVFPLFGWLKFIIPFTLSMLFIGPVAGLLFYWNGANPYSLPDGQNMRLLMVWCTQGALYIGTIIGTGISCYKIAKQPII